MRHKPGFFRRTRDAALVFFLIGVAVLALWVALGSCAEARGAELIDLPYRAYDRFPADAELTKFRSEDYSERKVAGAIRVMFSANLMPADDWLFLDGPMEKRIESVRVEHCEDAALRDLLAPHTTLRTIARLAEIPQEHPWMTEHRGQFRCYVAYLPAPASFPDTITVVSGAIGRCVAVWRSGREPGQ